MASDAGSVRNLATRIELPWTCTKNCEKKNDEPINAKPTTTIAVFDTVNNRSRNSRNGSIGPQPDRPDPLGRNRVRGAEQGQRGGAQRRRADALHHPPGDQPSDRRRDGAHHGRP